MMQPIGVEELVSYASRGFAMEMVAQFGDRSADGPGQKTILLLFHQLIIREPLEFLSDQRRIVAAWDYAQQWADESGRKIHLWFSYRDGPPPPAHAFKNASLFRVFDCMFHGQGVATFLSDAGGSSHDLPLPKFSAFSDRPRVGQKVDVDQLGEWHIPFSDPTEIDLYQGKYRWFDLLRK